MTRTTTALGAAAAVALALTLSACGGSGDSAPDVGAPVTGSSTATDPSTSPSTSTPSDASPSPSDASPTTGASTPAPGAGDRTASGLAAIAVAESETGGVAFAIDDSDDDGGWEVTVRTGDTAVEVRVGSDGTVVRTEPDDLDDDDRTAIDAVGITLAQAIETAVAETGGVLDDADLSDDDDQRHVEVTVDTADRTDVEVHLDPASGEVLRVE
ncbi:PepSY domain-containing protein [Litorihabitans aurantiacus]|uniref:PepSY domain-containing protein n=1 Tax=Litorihabitans aurantiacus TaxID=1930061 RepID=A0AA38CVJ2_9MICO|nr:PepSY domain-containing protein [Litorihabitans aurantiacus]GMA33010.1 hypothetical protein GCM10025875_30020 [Litorihabitans aurantiacus]